MRRLCSVSSLYFRQIDVLAARNSGRCVSSGSQASTSKAPASSPSVLTPQQVQQFDSDGFLFLPDLLTQAEIKDLVTWTGEVEKWPETAGKWMQYFETKDGARMLCRTENYLDYHSGLKSLIAGKLTDAISDAMGERAVLFKEKINFKYPGGAGFTAHQDAPAYITFPTRYHVSAMVAVDAMTSLNGCLQVVKGEHKRGLMPHPEGIICSSITKPYEEKGLWYEVIAPVGSVMLFHSYIPHKSNKNLSAQPRRAHYLTYNPLVDGIFRDAYYTDKRRVFPPDIERVPGVDYSEGAKVYNVSNPIPTMKTAA